MAKVIWNELGSLGAKISSNPSFLTGANLRRKDSKPEKPKEGTEKVSEDSEPQNSETKQK